MNYQIRRSDEREYIDHGWLKTHHTFSFGSYYDENFMGFRTLRVINEDRVDPGQGFPTHAHKNMEILSIVLEGTLGHQDSMGNKSVIHPNEVQMMSAGFGVTHSEYNPSSSPVHFLQIWIVPNSKNTEPRYQQTELPRAHNQWMLIGSKDGSLNSLKIHQDIEIFAILLDSGRETERKLASGRYGWLQVIDGDVKINEDTLHPGDGVAINENTSIKLKALSQTRLLFFNMN